VLDELAWNILSLAAAPDLLLLANNQYNHKGLVVVGIGEPTNPVEIGRLELIDGGASDVAVNGDVVYVIGRDALAVIDIADPANPVLVQTAPMGGTSVTVHGSTGYLLGTYPEVRIVDLTDPFAPVEMGQADLQGEGGYDLVPSGEMLYVATSGTVLEIIGPCGAIFADGFESGGVATWAFAGHSPR